MRKWFWRLLIVGLGGTLAIVLLRLLRDEPESEYATLLLPPNARIAFVDSEEEGEAVEPPPVVMRPVVRTAAASQDDLTRINGIGPAYARALAALGITSYAALAEQDAAVLAEQLRANNVRVIGDRILSEDWIGQARQLAGKQANP